MKRIGFLIVAGLMLGGTAAWAAPDDASVKVAWSYAGDTGPTKWGTLDKSFAACQVGKEQSPINISSKVNTVPDVLSVHYREAPTDIVNDGVTRLTFGNQATIVSSGHGVQLNFTDSKNTKPPFDIAHLHPTRQADAHTPTQEGEVVTVSLHKDYITLQDIDYSLVQFHFHTPAETALDNQSHPLEIHFVHQADHGKVAVVGVWVKEGKANPVLQKIIDQLPADHGVEHHIADEINPAILLPAKLNYYQFPGSLTTPPCTEGLAWYMMAEPITASKEQIEKIRAAEGFNARPLQPLNQRSITYSVEK